MNEFHLRVDKKALKDLALLENILKERCDSYLLSYEEPVDNPDNQHYQGYMRTLNKDITIRKDLTKILTLKGNKAYSLSALRKTKEELLQYCCKDGNVLFSTFTPEEVEIFKQVGNARKEDIEANVAKKKKRQAGSIFVQLKQHIQCEDSTNFQDLAYQVMVWYRENNKPMPPINRLQDLVRSLWIAKIPDEHFEKYAKSLAQQFFSKSPEASEIIF